MDEAVTLCLIARIPAGGRDAFAEYERQVLPILADHGGSLDRRVGTADQAVEIHLIAFTSRAGFDAYRDDRRRREALALMSESGAEVELLEVTPVEE